VVEGRASESDDVLAALALDVVEVCEEEEEEEVGPWYCVVVDVIVVALAESKWPLANSILFNISFSRSNRLTAAAASSFANASASALSFVISISRLNSLIFTCSALLKVSVLSSFFFILFIAFLSAAFLSRWGCATPAGTQGGQCPALIRASVHILRLDDASYYKV